MGAGGEKFRRDRGLMEPMKSTMTRPLDHITVVSLEHAIAAPFCTRQLADLGARVIKVERPGGGDFAPSTHGSSSATSLAMAATAPTATRRRMTC